MSKPAGIAAFVAVAFGLGVATFFTLGPKGLNTCSGSAVADGSSAIGGPFTLVNHKGETVTEKDIITGPTLIYFGYTYCPDDCPLDTARNAQAVGILDTRGIDVRLVFVTTDPARDTPQALADFVEAVHPRLIGLTGTPAQIDSAAKAYKTYYAKIGLGEDYPVEHLTYTYLMGTDGMWKFYRRSVSPAEMAESIACYVEKNT